MMPLHHLTNDQSKYIFVWDFVTMVEVLLATNGSHPKRIYSLSFLHHQWYMELLNVFSNDLLLAQVIDRFYDEIIAISLVNFPLNVKPVIRLVQPLCVLRLYGIHWKLSITIQNWQFKFKVYWFLLSNKKTSSRGHNSFESTQLSQSLWGTRRKNTILRCFHDCYTLKLVHRLKGHFLGPKDSSVWK